MASAQEDPMARLSRFVEENRQRLDVPEHDNTRYDTTMHQCTDMIASRLQQETGRSSGKLDARVERLQEENQQLREDAQADKATIEAMRGDYNALRSDYDTTVSAKNEEIERLQELAEEEPPRVEWTIDNPNIRLCLWDPVREIAIDYDEPESLPLPV